MMPRGIPNDLDAETTERIVRTFLLVRIVRGSLLLLFLAVALVGVELNGWPAAVALAVVFATLAQAAVLAANWRRYARAGSHRRSEH